MYHYFEDNYTWSCFVISALAMGGQINEIDQACSELKKYSADPGSKGAAAAFRAWNELGSRTALLAADDEKSGYRQSASRKYFRAAAYTMIAELNLGISSQEKLPAYDRVRKYCRLGIELGDRNVELVSFPFEDSEIFAYFLPASTDADKAPCLVHFNGFDWTKEMLYLVEEHDSPERGVSLLIVDQPGVGETLRTGALVGRHYTEVPAGACIDYLVSRGDIDPNRIGMLGLSAGGYYAPRAAAFEKRFACLAIWSATYDTVAAIQEGDETGAESVPEQMEYALWVMGVDSPDALMEKAAKMNLEGVLDKITCPTLLLHTTHDPQLPLWHAEKTLEGLKNAEKVDYKLFGPEHGGANHCMIDNMKVASDYVFDWVAETLEASPK